MIPRAPSLFHIEEEEEAPSPATASAPRELVGLRLIIQSSAPATARQQPLAVLRRAAMRPPTASASGFVGLEFLKICLCCHRKLDGDADVFVYKGEQAFCSAECRSQQMAKEERRKMEALVRKRRAAFHSRRAAALAPAKMTGSNWHTSRVQTAA